MPERWTRAVIRARLVVAGCWLAVFGVGIWAATGLPPLLVDSLSVPGSDADRAQAILAERYGQRPDGTFTVVFRVPDSRSKAAQAAARRRLARAARALPGGHARALRAGPGVLFGDVATDLSLQRAKLRTPAVRAAVRSRDGPRALVTGQPALQHDLDPVFAGDLRRGEAIAIPAALLVLVAVLGLSPAVLVPFAVAAGAIGATLAAVYGIAHGVSMVSYVVNLVELLGLGLAVDYSLLVVFRYREETAAGAEPDDAVVRATATAGRAVLFSGLAVAVGLALLTAMPVPFLRSMGIAGCLIPLASVAAALTLQPALLSLLGSRAVRRAPAGAGGFWARLAAALVAGSFSPPPPPP